MSDYTIENNFLLLKVSRHGAEMRSLKNKSSNAEYLWNADPAFWARTAPVLFPLVGNYKDKTSVYNGASYKLGQHGFARDSDFMLNSQKQDEVWFSLSSSGRTKEVYPFDFELSIGYKLCGRTVRVLWNVKNTDLRKMYFSIGAHPAFLCELGKDSLLFDTDEPLSYGVLNSAGLLAPETKTLPLKEKTLLLTNELFLHDALIIEENQTHSVSLLRSGKKWVSVTFDAPVLGLWSPAGKNAPFVCIEPWYGRTDKADFCQDLTKREWSQSLMPSQNFCAEYSIETF